MKAKVYIETTIPSYLAAKSSRDLLVAAHQQITRDWWELRRPTFELYVSELVVQEVKAGDALLANRRLELLRELPYWQSPTRSRNWPRTSLRLDRFRARQPAMPLTSQPRFMVASTC